MAQVMTSVWCLADAVQPNRTDSMSEATAGPIEVRPLQYGSEM